MKKYILFLLIINIILSIALINKNKKITENNIYLNSNTINIVDYLKNKSNNKEIQEYENGNIQEMFIFEHPETDQVSANTDYRYIGNNPNNYIKRVIKHNGEYEYLIDGVHPNEREGIKLYSFSVLRN